MNTLIDVVEGVIPLALFALGFLVGRKYQGQVNIDLYVEHYDRGFRDGKEIYTEAKSVEYRKLKGRR